MYTTTSSLRAQFLILLRSLLMKSSITYIAEILTFFISRKSWENVWPLNSFYLVTIFCSV
ncbi:Hypothetical predicted protein [Pelobates cultripes]|uniref:Uncharacterized protein n=1 Tax=Pelobates cultripes TaxID=61616 RepID=A0AAD1RXI1_PELCU|nr:Hypothetical predicted protein [Pelobates cultripes]